MKNSFKLMLVSSITLTCALGEANASFAQLKELEIKKRTVAPTSPVSTAPNDAQKLAEQLRLEKEELQKQLNAKTSENQSLAESKANKIERLDKLEQEKQHLLKETERLLNEAILKEAEGETTPQTQINDSRRLSQNKASEEDPLDNYLELNDLKKEQQHLPKVNESLLNAAILEEDDIQTTDQTQKDAISRLAASKARVENLLKKANLELEELKKKQENLSEEETTAPTQEDAYNRLSQSKARVESLLAQTSHNYDELKQEKEKLLDELNKIKSNASSKNELSGYEMLANALSLLIEVLQSG